MVDYLKLADIIVKAEYTCEYLHKQCLDYIVSPDKKPDICVCVTPEDISNERELSPELAFSNGYLESLAFYRKFSQDAANFDCFLFHGSALSLDGNGFLFGAPSGTGKSTHARLYREVYEERVTMVNDDKPLIRKLNGIYRVYGTPWDGKHRLSNNMSVPLRGICFLKQGAENRIRKLSGAESFMQAMGQVYRPECEQALRNVLSLTAELVSAVPVFEMYCTISAEAVKMSYETMKGVCSQ